MGYAHPDLGNRPFIFDPIPKELYLSVVNLDMRWKCIAAYDGTGFYGWQSQTGGNTIQDIIEGRLQVIFKRPVRIHGSGRTDSGAHAHGQVFHFDAQWEYPADDLLRALRSGLPERIQVNAVKRVANTFHARKSATGKRYLYRLYEGFAPPQETRYCWSLDNRRLDIESMREASLHLIGKHDFTAFSADRGNDSPENPVKDLRLLEVRRKGPRVRITAEAGGFLYKMVRSLAGALVDVGIGKLAPGEIPLILKSRQRTALIATAPSRGLSLEKVYYRPRK